MTRKFLIIAPPLLAVGGVIFVVIMLRASLPSLGGERRVTGLLTPLCRRDVYGRHRGVNHPVELCGLLLNARDVNTQ